MTIEQIAESEDYKNFARKISGYGSNWEDLFQEFLLKVLENKDKLIEIFERGEQDYYFYSIIYNLWNHPKQGRHKLKTHRVGTSTLYNLTDNESDLKDYRDEIRLNELSASEREIRSRLKQELSILLKSKNEGTKQQGLFLFLYIEGKNRLEISKSTGINYRIVHDSIEEAIQKIRARVTNKTYMTKTEIQITLKGEGVTKIAYSGKDRTFYVDKIPASGIVKEIEQAGYKVKKNGV